MLYNSEPFWHGNYYTEPFWHINVRYYLEGAGGGWNKVHSSVPEWLTIIKHSSVPEWLSIIVHISVPENGSLL